MSKNFACALPELILIKGAHLTSFNAILRFIASQSKDIKIIGETEFQKAKVDQWLEFLQNYLLPIIVEYMALKGGNKETNSFDQQLYFLLNILNKELEMKTFMDSVSKTVADIAIIGTIFRLYKFYIPVEVKNEFANFNRYFEFMTSDPIFQKHFGDEPAPENAVAQSQPQK